MKRCWLAFTCILLACAAPAFAQPPPTAAIPPPPLATRDPELRMIDPVKDAIVLKRIDFIRRKLPEPYLSRNNFAWAIARINGLEKAEYFAHSSIQDLEAFSLETGAQLAGISLKPAPGRFSTLCVNQLGAVQGADCWQRDVDTEYKILDDLAGRLTNSAATGKILLFTELYPCPSCWNVMKQFLALYPGVEMRVLYRTP